MANLSDYPQLLKEYQGRKNGNLLPDKIKDNSKWRLKVITWTCEQGHDWKEHFVTRIHSDPGCPKCNWHKRIQEPEQADEGLSFNYIFTTVAKFMTEERRLPSTSENIAISRIYNAIQKGNKEIDDNIKNWPHLLSIIIKDMFSGDIKRELKEQYQQKLYFNRKREWRPYGLKLNSKNQLKSKRSDLIKQLHPTLNYGKMPHKMHYESDTVLWWKCDLKHQYRMSLSKRTVEGKNCPICSFDNPKIRDAHKPKYFWQTLDPGYNYALQVIIDYFIEHQKVPAASENKSIFRVYKALRNPKVKQIWGVDSWPELLRMTIGNLGYELGDLRDKLIESYNYIATRQKHLAWERIIV